MSAIKKTTLILGVLGKRKFLLSLMVLLGVAVEFQNCSKIPLSPYKVDKFSLSQVSTDFCTTPATVIKTKLKFIFVLDRSGSNCNQYQLQADGTYKTYPGTDPAFPTAVPPTPAGFKRFPQILKFVQNYTIPDMTLLSFAAVNFSDTSGNHQWQQSGNPTQNFTDQATFSQYMTNEYQPYLNGGCVDDGFTDYDSSLTTAFNMIQADIKAAKNAHEVNGQPLIASNYVIFFVSDGAPWVLDPQDGTKSILQSSDLIQADVNNIVTLKDNTAYSDYVDGITLNTVYYTNEFWIPTPPAGMSATDITNLTNGIQQADQLLSDMALKWGGGTHLSLLNGQAIDFQQFAIPQKINHFDLREVFVYDVNEAWDVDKNGFATLNLDTDGDGLSDITEKALGSDPTKIDSDGNGISDFVEYYLNGKPCASNGCKGAAMSVPASCAQYRSGGSFIDTDLDDLNDCEELLLGSKRDDPDTNLDNIPDGLGLRAGIEIVKASNASTSDRDSDGLTDYQEVKYVTPVSVNNINISMPKFKTVQYNLQMTSHNVNQDCYHLDISNMIFMTDHDKLRFYILERANLQTSHLVFRRAEAIENFGTLYVPESAYQVYQK